MAVEIEPLFAKLASYAPHFGRAQGDLEAMVSRGRVGDYKGVMQNARLVLEALLRSLVTEELKQTPGKAMLDELVTKFRQQANAGIVPTNILAHMGTVQAWGNLSAHDHAGSLTDAGVQVGLEEVVASLNSMVAILGWYANKRGLLPRELATPFSGNAAVAKAEPAPAVVAQPAPKPGGSSKIAIAVGAAVLLVAGVGGAIAMSSKSETTAAKPDVPAGDPFAALNAVYTTRKEPVPPDACRRADEATQLAKNASNADALKLIDKPSPEAAYLYARVAFEDLKQKAPEQLAIALGCDGFAAAQHLAAQVAIAENRIDEARTHLETAKRQAPKYLDARAKLAGIMVAQGQLDDALAEADQLIKADGSYAPAYLIRFSARFKKGEAGAIDDLCKAKDNGSAQARDKVAELAAKGVEVPCAR